MKFLNILCKTEVWAYSTVCKNAPKIQIRLQAVCKQIADGLLHNVHYRNKKNAPKEGV